MIFALAAVYAYLTSFEVIGLFAPFVFVADLFGTAYGAHRWGM